MNVASNDRELKELLLDACEDAHIILAIIIEFAGEANTTESERLVLDKLKRAIRAAGGRVIGADGREVE